MRAANANIIHCNYIGRRSQASSIANSRRYGNIFLLLGQSRRRWSKLRSTLAQPSVLAGVVAWIQGYSARAAYMQLGQNSLVFRATAVVTQCGDIPWRCMLERQARSPADLWQKGSVSDKSTKICILIVYYTPKHISYGPNLNFNFFQNWRPFSNMATKFVNFDSSSGLVVSISEYKSKKSSLWAHQIKVVIS